MSALVVLLAGLVATLAMTTLMSASQWLGLSRMSLPFMLGLAVTSDRDRAMPLGFVIHVVNGLVLSALYGALFLLLGPSWWLGALLGLGHFLVVFLVLLPMLPAIHPRMASLRDGPEPTRQLEPPGFLGLGYGSRTPLTGVIAHVTYGVILGALLQVSA